MRPTKFLYTSIYKNCDECKMQLMSNAFNTFKVNDLTHMQMLIVQKMEYKCEALSCYVCFNIYQ